jgi:hypothetical protein
MMRKTDSIQLFDRTIGTAGGVESGSTSAGGTMINWVRGLIHSQYAGLVRAGVRIKVGARTDLRVRWARKEESGFVVGQPVVAMIPATAVRLESGMLPPEQTTLESLGWTHRLDPASGSTSRVYGKSARRGMDAEEPGAGPWRARTE